MREYLKNSMFKQEPEIIPMAPIPEMSPAEEVIIPLDIKYEEKFEPGQSIPVTSLPVAESLCDQIKRNGSPIL